MKSITTHEVPARLYRALRIQSGDNNRTVEEEAIAILQEEFFGKQSEETNTPSQSSGSTKESSTESKDGPQ